MNGFLNLLRAELLKFRSKLALLWILLPILLMVLLGSQMDSLIAKDPNRQQWSFFFQLLAAHWGVFLATPFIVFWSTHTMVMEQRTWKLLACQGTSRTVIFLVKATATLGFILLQSLVLGILFFIAGHFLNLQGDIPWTRILLLVFTFATALPIVACQMLLATFSSRLLVLLIPGIFGHFVCLLAIRIPAGRFFPWSFSLETLKLRGPDAFSHPMYIVTAFMVGCLLLAAGIWRFRRQAL